MAYTVNLVGTHTDQAVDTCIIPNTNGITLGEILVAHICFFGDGAPGGTDSVAAPAGWTEQGLPLIDGGMMYVGTKVATATEVSASDFTFTATGTAGNRALIGKISKITGGREGNIGYAKANASSGAGTATTVTVGTITPSIADSLILFFMSAGAALPGFSAYAMATSNPSWTEAYDVSYDNANADLSIAFAYASRPETTGTGNVTATISADLFWSGLVMAIAPQITTTVADSTTLTDAALMGLSTIKTESVTCTDTADADEVTVILNQDKNVSTWLNQDKS